MFANLKYTAVLALATLAVAVPNSGLQSRNDPPPSDSPQCCNSVVSSTSSVVSGLLALLGIDLGGANIPIGLSCSPITVIGNNCGGTTVTCEAPQKEWAGLIAINCLPITL
ncbi:Hydrophobin 2 [Mycena indigotica]|uniref:Hydrophobin n=1 Tax=Mycena indigotica TaxID=2126181 RepID=A0A8H6VUP6_9AGAR|nr:Hydrophobin 2 [Mycena indigotica]KAF7288909.1 Hydrophobin 2 [Mycena indigotica]